MALFVIIDFSILVESRRNCIPRPRKVKTVAPAVAAEAPPAFIPDVVLPALAAVDFPLAILDVATEAVTNPPTAAPEMIIAPKEDLTASPITNSPLICAMTPRYKKSCPPRRSRKRKNRRKNRRFCPSYDFEDRY